jgi:hypothetical protein
MLLRAARGGTFEEPLQDVAHAQEACVCARARAPLSAGTPCARATHDDAHRRSCRAPRTEVVAGVLVQDGRGQNLVLAQQPQRRLQRRVVLQRDERAWRRALGTLLVSHRHVPLQRPASQHAAHLAHVVRGHGHRLHGGGAATLVWPARGSRGGHICAHC